jgi:hypothetical protein
MSYFVGAGSYLIIPLVRLNLVKFFRSRGAVSEDKALEMKEIDWLENGVDFDVNGRVFPYLIKTSGDKWWLDEEKYVLFAKDSLKFNGIVLKWVFIGLGAFVVLGLVFGFVVEALGL